MIVLCAGRGVLAAVVPTDGADGAVCVATPCTAIKVCCIAGADELCTETTTGTGVTGTAAPLGIVADFAMTVFAGFGAFLVISLLATFISRPKFRR